MVMEYGRLQPAGLQQSLCGTGEKKSMENNLFRKKSLESISSADELQNYMRATSPRLWMIALAVILLLAGFLAYASSATMESTMKIQLSVQSFETMPDYQAQGGTARYSLVSSILPLSLKDTVSIGMPVRLGKEEGKVSFIAIIAARDEISLIIDMNEGYVEMPDGEYEAELVLKSTTPISFLWN